MRVKEYLSQAIYLQRRIIRCDEQIEEIRSRMESAGAIRYDKINIQQSPSNDVLTNYMIQLEKAESKSIELRAIYYATYNQISEQIRMVDPPILSEILAMRWLDGRDLNTISIIMKYSYDHIRHLHGEALRKFDQMFLKDSTQ